MLSQVKNNKIDPADERTVFIAYVSCLRKACAYGQSNHIRIYHECDGRIEKIVLRIAVWHLKAIPMMTNGDPEGWIFLSYPHTNNGFFSLLTTVFFFI